MQFVKEYGNIAWSFLTNILDEELNYVMDLKYKKLNKKLQKLLNPNVNVNENNYNVNNVGLTHKFNDRVINMSNVTFSKNETDLLSYGPKHNFVISRNKQIDMLATDIECNVTQLKDCNRNEIRHDVSKICKNMKLQTNNRKQVKDYMLCLDVKEKLQKEDLVVVKADKSNAIVILKKDDYITKTEDFIRENKFQELKNDPTVKFQEEITKLVKSCTNVISADERFKAIMNNPKAPTMNGIPKIHKPNVPIRPLVNFRNAPTYNVSKILSKILSDNLNLEYKYNIKNSIDFVNKVNHIQLCNNTRLASFDICNLYTNVPINEVIEIVKNKLVEEKFDNVYVNQIVKLLKAVLKQNYFRFNNKFYLQKDGLAMGSPLSAILSEVFLQHNENSLLNKIKINHDILFYTRYVDDILVIFNEKTCHDLDNMLTILNCHHSNLKFTSEFETLSQLNFLDLVLMRVDNKLCFKIFRKPTQTNCTINNTSVHPMSHKMSSFRSMLYRAYSIPLSVTDRKQEINIIKTIARANGYKPSIIDEIGNRIKRKIDNKKRQEYRTTLNRETTSRPIKKYVCLNYNGNYTQKVANKFKKYDLSIAFKTSNTLATILHPNIENKDKFCNSGIYKVKCNDCDMFYIGQTVNFNKRYKNHVSAFKNQKPDRSNVAKHLLNCNHSLNSIDENMDIIKICKKGKIMNAWEELYIFKDKLKHRELLINEQINFDSEIVYKNVLLGNRERRHLQ